MDAFMLIVKVVEALGIVGVIFVIWYLQHLQFKETLKQQSEREKENFGLLKDMIGQIGLQNGLLQKLASRIETNQWCPYVKDKQRGTIE